ncbi:MAG: dihydroneopterin aldolase [Bacteroidetes bacterium]|nr:dihydroneopterin aldolase [Bacteroidota bacterium]
MSLIKLEGMEFFAYHGCFKEEQVIGTKFIIDLSIEADVKQAALKDDLNLTINYLSVYQMIKKQMEIKSKLLENVGKRILDELYNQFPGIIKAEVKVSKLNPPLGGKLDCVSLTLSR